MTPSLTTNTKPPEASISENRDNSNSAQLTSAMTKVQQTSELSNAPPPAPITAPTSALSSAPLERPNRLRKTRLFKCPLCMGSFPASDIEAHASHCLEVNAPVISSSKKEKSAESKKDKKTGGHSKFSPFPENPSKSLKKSMKAGLDLGAFTLNYFLKYILD